MPSASAVIGPLKAAVLRHRTRRVAPSAMRTADWAGVPEAIRSRAFLSAGVEDARTLDAMLDMIDRHLAMDTTSGPAVTKASFLRDMRRLLGAEGKGDSNSLTDLGSRRRLALIFDMNVAEARGYADYLRDMTGPGIEVYPAQELVRVHDSAVPRDWEARWEEVGAPFFGGRMIALKASPVWAAISRFDRPWPPFDFNSGMGLLDISREESERLGLLRRGERAPRAVVPDFNDGVELDAAHLSESALDRLRSQLGDLVDIADGKIRMAPQSAGARASSPASEGGLA